MVYVLTGNKFLGKSWSSGKQETMGSEMGKAGLTQSGKAITHQSVRTLLANIPKYLGFIFLDDTTTPPKIVVTDVGNELLQAHNIENIRKHKTLSEYEQAEDLIEISDVFKKQMLKLIITNPVIYHDCEKILVFPFRMTLKLLIELDYLDTEEIGYILFRAKHEDEFQLLITKIKNFRSLSPIQRTNEINAYKNTEEGILTNVKAPTAGYYMYLCYSTGLCDRIVVSVNKTNNSKLPALKLKNKSEIKNSLDKFNNVKIYDFKKNISLWKKYFSNPQKLFPPFNVKIKVSTSEDLLVVVYHDNENIFSAEISKNQPEFIIPVFKKDFYKIMIYSYQKNKPVFSKQIQFLDDKDFLLDLNMQVKQQVSEKILVKQISQMFSSKYSGFDEEYYAKLQLLEKVLGKKYVDNYRKGGRLEFLFVELLKLLKKKGNIDEVFWYGKIGEYGICKPAPGGKVGYPDVVFEIDEYVFVLELTTIKGVRAQWNSSEASSVPDHISRLKKEYYNKKTIGIFSAPSVHQQVEKNLTLNAKNEQVGMIFEPCVEFADFLAKANRKELKERLIQKSKIQLNN